MKPHVRTEVLQRIAIVWKGLQPNHEFLNPSELFLGDPKRCRLAGQPFQDGKNVDQIKKLLQARIANPGSLVRFHLNQSFGRQHAQGLTEWGARDPEFLGKLALGKNLVWLQVFNQDEIPDAVGSPIRKCIT
jgi:hypothetical protein